MADKKIVFVAFPIEDQKIRDLLKGQSLNTKCPIEFIDMSVKEPYNQNEWQDRVRTRIKRSHGVLAIITKNSVTSTGQKWELKCAREEVKPIRGFWGYQGDHTEVAGVKTTVWSWDTLAAWIDSL